MGNASFYYGAGLMGVVAGSGIVGQSNKVALVLGLASLFYAHQLEPIVDVKALPAYRDVVPDLPKVPTPSFQGRVVVDGS